MGNRHSSSRAYNNAGVTNFAAAQLREGQATYAMDSSAYLTQRVADVVKLLLKQFLRGTCEHVDGSLYHRQVRYSHFAVDYIEKLQLLAMQYLVSTSSAFCT